MISDVQLALFVNFMGVILFMMVVSYIYLKCNATGNKRVKLNRLREGM